MGGPKNQKLSQEKKKFPSSYFLTKTEFEDFGSHLLRLNSASPSGRLEWGLQWSLAFS